MRAKSACYLPDNSNNSHHKTKASLSTSSSKANFRDSTRNDNIAALSNKTHCISVGERQQKADKVMEEKIGQVVQLTGCSKDLAFVALYDCDNQPERAIEHLLENNNLMKNEWTESRGRRRSAQNKQIADSSNSSHKSSSTSADTRTPGAQSRSHQPPSSTAPHSTAAALTAVTHHHLVNGDASRTTAVRHAQGGVSEGSLPHRGRGRGRAFGGRPGRRARNPPAENPSSNSNNNREDRQHTDTVLETHCTTAPASTTSTTPASSRRRGHRAVSGAGGLRRPHRVYTASRAPGTYSQVPGTSAAADSGVQAPYTRGDTLVWGGLSVSGAVDDAVVAADDSLVDIGDDDEEWNGSLLETKIFTASVRPQQPETLAPQERCGVTSLQYSADMHQWSADSCDTPPVVVPPPLSDNVRSVLSADQLSAQMAPLDGGSGDGERAGGQGRGEASCPPVVFSRPLTAAAAEPGSQSFVHRPIRSKLQIPTNPVQMPVNSISGLNLHFGRLDFGLSATDSSSCPSSVVDRQVVRVSQQEESASGAHYSHFVTTKDSSTSPFKMSVASQAYNTFISSLQTSPTKCSVDSANHSSQYTSGQYAGVAMTTISPLVTSAGVFARAPCTAVCAATQEPTSAAMYVDTISTSLSVTSSAASAHHVSGNTTAVCGTSAGVSIKDKLVEVLAGGKNQQQLGSVNSAVNQPPPTLSAPASVPASVLYHTQQILSAPEAASHRQARGLAPSLRHNTALTAAQGGPAGFQPGGGMHLPPAYFVSGQTLPQPMAQPAFYPTNIQQLYGAASYQPHVHGGGAGGQEDTHSHSQNHSPFTHYSVQGEAANRASEQASGTNSSAQNVSAANSASLGAVDTQQPTSANSTSASHTVSSHTHGQHMGAYVQGPPNASHGAIAATASQHMCSAPVTSVMAAGAVPTTPLVPPPLVNSAYEMTGSKYVAVSPRHMEAAGSSTASILHQPEHTPSLSSQGPFYNPGLPANYPYFQLMSPYGIYMPNHPRPSYDIPGVGGAITSELIDATKVASTNQQSMGHHFYQATPADTHAPPTSRKSVEFAKLMSAQASGMVSRASAYNEAVGKPSFAHHPHHPHHHPAHITQQSQQQPLGTHGYPHHGHYQQQQPQSQQLGAGHYYAPPATYIPLERKQQQQTPVAASVCGLVSTGAPSSASYWS